MDTTSPHVPTSIPEDTNDVVTALDVAGALWEKGDRAEALRWLNRAVEAAGEAGNPARAADLAQAAGMLEAGVEGGVPADATVPPPAESVPLSVAPATAAPGQEPWPDSSRRVLAPAAVPADAVADAHSRTEGWLRVSVKTSVRDPKLLVLRPLADGEAAPVGTREGFLVLADSLRSARKRPNGGEAV
jgi:hypothetical protein